MGGVPEGSDPETSPGDPEGVLEGSKEGLRGVSEGSGPPASYAAGRGSEGVSEGSVGGGGAEEECGGVLPGGSGRVLEL